MKVIKLKAGNIMELIEAIMSGNFTEVKPCEAREQKPLTIPYFIQKVADRKGWKYEKANGWLAGIEEISPVAAFSIILREIAIELDKKYEDHIENSEEIYIISTANGRIIKANKKGIKNYKNFAAFRTMEDAKLAYNIMKSKIKGMFGTYVKQKD